MVTPNVDELKYPIGKFSMPDSFSNEKLKNWIHSIDHLPFAILEAVTGLNDQQLDTPYRDGGWTLRQVVHHLADSHINSYCRFKLAMTEQTPQIRPYNEKEWALLEDGQHGALELSLDLLKALHFRWVYFLRSLTTEDWQRKFYHPDSKKEYTLYVAAALYAWHGEHHLAHIVNLKKRMGWA